MAKTQISDVIEPSLFAEYTIQATREKSRLFTSGILGGDEQITPLLGDNGGGTVNMPFWNDLSGDSEVLSDTSSLTPAKIDASQDVAVLNLRGKAWSANDLAGVLAGDDPMGAIVNRAGAWWARDMQSTILAILEGLFAASGELATTHNNDVAIEDGDSAAAGNLFSDTNFLNTVFKLGDDQEAFQALVCHSTVMQTMLELDLIQYVNTASASPEQVPFYRGREVIVDDGVTTVAGGTSGYKYSTYIFGPGAIGYGEKVPPVPVEMDRDALAGDDILVNRRHYVLHPRGIKWVGTAAGAAPTNTEFSTESNWSKVYEDKAIRLAQLKTNG